MNEQPQPPLTQAEYTALVMMERAQHRTYPLTERGLTRRGGLWQTQCIECHAFCDGKEAQYLLHAETCTMHPLNFSTDYSGYLHNHYARLEALHGATDTDAAGLPTGSDQQGDQQ
jgi:hypothetical protein